MTVLSVADGTTGTESLCGPLVIERLRGAGLACKASRCRRSVCGVLHKDQSFDDLDKVHHFDDEFVHDKVGHSRKNSYSSLLSSWRPRNDISRTEYLSLWRIINTPLGVSATSNSQIGDSVSGLQASLNQRRYQHVRSGRP